MITAQLVKDLREKTGAGMMDCKKVLTETDGDMEKAIELLRERGIAKAAKKSSRVAAEGLVDAYVSEDGKVGAIVEVNSETDFVAKNAEFQEFVKKVAKIVAEKNPADVDALLEETYESEGKSVKDVLTDKIAKIGENMTVRRFVRYETDGFVETYIHGNGKIAVIVDMAKGDHTAAKDVCMQIAAVRPEYINEEDVPADRVEKEKEILKAQVINEGRPENVADKIVAGRLGKFYEQICLVDQAFVKDPNQKVKDLLKSKNASVKRFARFEKGEGLEKREENFAEEVAKQING